MLATLLSAQVTDIQNIAVVRRLSVWWIKTHSRTGGNNQRISVILPQF